MNTAIGEAILAQMGGAGRIAAMINAKFTIAGDGVLLRFPNPSGRPNACAITLEPDDTYHVRFYRGIKDAGQFKGVYCDQLREMFEKQTGLYLSL